MVIIRIHHRLSQVASLRFWVPFSASWANRSFNERSHLSFHPASTFGTSLRFLAPPGVLIAWAFSSRFMPSVAHEACHAPLAFISAVFRYQPSCDLPWSISECVPSLLGVNRSPVRHRSWDFLGLTLRSFNPAQEENRSSPSILAPRAVE